MAPTAYCWSGEVSAVCVDGIPADPLPDVGRSGELEVSFPAPGWRFTATLVEAGPVCGRSQRVELEATGQGTHRLSPRGQAGTYDVHLFGRAGEGASNRGDISATFRWRTTHDAPTVPPSATASIVSGDPGGLRSHGAEVSIQGLPSTPPPGWITARAVVTSSSGASLPIELEQNPSSDCRFGGGLYFTAAEELGRRAAALGPAPFRYDVTVVIDSIPYRGTGSWPDDVDAACSPCTRLRFTPALPNR